MVKLKKNAELISEIRRLCKEKAIEKGFVMAIGALRKAKLGYVAEKGDKFREIEVNKQVELASASGIIVTRNSETTVHIHAVLGDEKETYLGHLIEGIVNPIVEIFIVSISH